MWHSVHGRPIKVCGVYMWVWIRHSAMHWNGVVLSLNIFTA